MAKKEKIKIEEQIADLGIRMSTLEDAIREQIADLRIRISTLEDAIKKLKRQLDKIFIEHAIEL